MDLIINKKKYSVNSTPEESLLNVLRNDLDLTGTKYGCGEGSCGACTVLINDVAVRSCITKATSVEGKAITTIEGLAINDKLHPVQQAFLNVDVFQCSYCASGMVMSTVSLLKKKTEPTDEEIINGMQGNVCRCGTYPRIIKGIHEAMKIQKS
jgi:aerobic-type carbon monoxide dehydrogenase small subunit (CoxS/CutS family)